MTGELLPPIDDRDAWLDWRRGGIGGSDIAAVCGLSKFSGATPLGVYLDKTGLIDAQAESEAMRWGNLLEAPIVREFELRTGLYVACEQWRAVDDAHPWRRATIDGLVFRRLRQDAGENALGLLEVKTTGDRDWDELPDGYALQCQWAMGILGLKRAWLAVLFRGQRLDITALDFDPAVYAALGRIGDAFWADNVVAGVPPAPAARDLDAVRDAWRTRVDDGKRIEATPELLKLAELWLDAKDYANATAARADELEARLRLELGDAVALEADGIDLLTLKPQNTAARIDEKALRGRLPLTAARFTKPAGTTRVLRATKALKTTHREGAIS
jgi:putative phage-type endonuclease